jgi:hypothetical protein
VLKPGGRIAILEGNQSSVETSVVRLVRRVIRRKSKVTSAPGGLEFWSEIGGQPFVVRIANIGHLVTSLEARNCRLVRRFGTELFDAYRFPAVLRNFVTALNNAAFHAHLPPRLAVGNAVIAQKIAS